MLLVFCSAPEALHHIQHAPSKGDDALKRGSGVISENGAQIVPTAPTVTKLERNPTPASTGCQPACLLRIPGRHSVQTRAKLPTRVGQFELSSLCCQLLFMARLHRLEAGHSHEELAGVFFLGAVEDVVYCPALYDAA